MATVGQLQLDKLELVKQLKEQRDLVKKWQTDYKVLEDKFHALEIEDAKKQAYFDKIQKEGATLVYGEPNITNIIHVEPYFKVLDRQVIRVEIEKALGTKYYALYPFGKEVNGVVEIDQEQYNKYKGAILL